MEIMALAARLIGCRARHTLGIEDGLVREPGFRRQEMIAPGP